MLLLSKSIIRDNFKSNLIVTIIVVIITVVSYYKMNILEEPFIPNDLFLITNIGQIAEYGLSIPPLTLVFSVLLLINILILQYALESKHKINTKAKPSRKNKIINAVFRIVIFIISVTTLYITCIMLERFDKLAVNNSLGDNYNWMGANAVFFMHIGDFYTIAPKNYSNENIDKIEEGYVQGNAYQEQTATQPNVIIMNESFIDPYNIKIVKYSKNPIGDLINLAQTDDNCKIGDTFWKSKLFHILVILETI